MALPRVDEALVWAGESAPRSTGAPAPLQVLLDFDGTLVEPNVAILLVSQFCEGGDRISHEIDLALHEGRMTLREAWAREVALLPTDRLDEMIQFVRANVPLRAGSRELCAYLDHHAIPTSIVSGGLDFFIRPVLEREDLRYPVLSDTMVARDGRWSVAFPHGHATCRLCGICKAQVVTSFQQRTGRVVFIGDGSTDRYAAEVADVVFARKRLLEYCHSAGIPCLPFDDLRDVVRELRRAVEEGTPIPPRAQRGLPQSPCPISKSLAAMAPAANAARDPSLHPG